MTRAVIVDIDGTLADLSHRIHHVRGGAHDWPSFFAAIGDDAVIEPVRDLVRMIAADGTPIVLCSGRPDDCRDGTVAWLNLQGIPFDALYMRPAGDYRPDQIVKRQILDGIIADGFQPILVIDDRQRVVDMWREAGLVCLQAAPGDFDDPAPINRPSLLTLMIGPSGAGKSTWLRSDAAMELGIRAAHVIASDQIREDICGDFRDQTQNESVFAALHAVTRARLAAGLPTVIDATNLHRKDRLSIIACGYDLTLVRYIIVDRPMDQKRRDAGWRGTLPFDLLTKHHNSFKSALRDILSGDGNPATEVIDLRATLKEYAA